MQYAAHADSKSTIDIGDLKMAIQARVNTSFTPAPSREVSRQKKNVRNNLILSFNMFRFCILLQVQKIVCLCHCHLVVLAPFCRRQRCVSQRPTGNWAPSNRRKRLNLHCLLPKMPLHTQQRSLKQSHRHTNFKSLRQAWRNSNKSNLDQSVSDISSILVIYKSEMTCLLDHVQNKQTNNKNCQTTHTVIDFSYESMILNTFCMYVSNNL
jgi:hypothetical protein